MAVCSQLPQDIWCLIGEKLHDTADRIRFRSVCTSLRSIVSFPQPPWLMLAEDPQSPHTRGFFGLGHHHQQQGKQQDLYQLELPEAHLVRCVGSTGTWLITIDGQEQIRLLNPFSRRQIDLPSQQTFEFRLRYEDLHNLTPHFRRIALLHKAIISSSPSSSDCVVMMIYHVWKRLAIARPGDAAWTTVPTPNQLFFKDAIFYKQQFYAIDHNGILVVCNHLSHPPTATLLTTENFKIWSDQELFYLVEWMGELLFVIKFMDNNIYAKTYKVNRFQIHMFDFTNKSWNELKCLGEYSLFLGYNTSTAVLASDYPGLKNNCIYFTDDYRHGYLSHQIPGGTDMGVFDLEDNSVKPHYKGTSTCFYSPPIWIVPQIHPPPAAHPHATQLD